jgi:hypothetical protein
MKTDFKLWQRATLEQFARKVADSHLMLTEQIKATAWRPVSELPTSDQTVLLFDGSLPDCTIWPGSYDLAIGWTYCDAGLAKPTHWMPMPAGPVLPAKADAMSEHAAIDKYLAMASHVFSDSQDAMQCIDYIQAVRDCEDRKMSANKAPDWSAA